MSLFLGATTIDAVYAGIPGTSFAPVSVFINTVGAWTYPVPAGANRLDVVVFGAGGAGGPGGTTSNGKGGAAGGSSSRTFFIGSDHPATNVVGTNGAGGSSTGQATSVTSGTAALTANGGAFANQSGSNGADAADVSFNGNIYAGGKGSTALGGVGGQPGGGGAGGRQRATSDGGNGGTYLRFYNVGASAPGLAQAVYLGTEKVWPIYVATLSPWFKPNPLTGNGSQTAIYIDWPVGAEFCDAIVIGGGAGGTGTGVGGNPKTGGGAGAWQGFTIPRTGELQADQAGGTQGQPITYNRIYLSWGMPSGGDGVGGGNFNTDAADGSYMFVSPRNFTSLQDVKAGPQRVGSVSQDQTSNTGNRNGGNVATTFTFNGRTYTLDSYGVNAGRGGATSNKNGGSGNAPGGGGQSADNGGLTGYSGGNGAHGAAILYWY